MSDASGEGIAVAGFVLAFSIICAAAILATYLVDAAKIIAGVE